MKKSNLGALVILAGIGIIGFVWFRRNKPTTADKQLADLTAQSNALKSNNIDTIDKPFEYGEAEVKNNIVNPYTSTWSLISKEEQAQISQAVTENVNCGFGLTWTNTDCTDYNIRQQQQANPNNVNTSSCNPPKLLITNVERYDAGFPKQGDNGSLWAVYFSVCGGNPNDLPPVSYKITVIDSVGSQEIVVDKNYYGVFKLTGNLARNPKTAVINLSITDKKGKNYIQTFNYKE
jgi:hypothetical protein